MATTEDDVMAGGASRPDEIHAVPVRHPGRWVAAVIILVLVVQFGHWLITNPTFQWDVVGDYLFNNHDPDRASSTRSS